jgi:uncharacterized membrane protein
VIPIAIGLALAAAVFHGTWNVLVKVSGDPITTFRRVTLTTALVATITFIPAWFVIGRPGLNPEAAAWCVLSSLLETAYLWLLSTAYRRGELSAVYPIARGSAPLLSVLVGLVLLGEKLAALQLIGVGLLLVGILAVTMSQATGRATVPALLTGVAIAAYTSVDRVGVRLTTPWLYGWLLFSLMAIELPVSLWIAARLGLHRPPASGGPSWRQAIVIGFFMWDKDQNGQSDLGLVDSTSFIAYTDVFVDATTPKLVISRVKSTRSVGKVHVSTDDLPTVRR